MKITNASIATRIRSNITLSMARNLFTRLALVSMPFLIGCTDQTIKPDSDSVYFPLKGKARDNWRLAELEILRSPRCRIPEDKLPSVDSEVVGEGVKILIDLDIKHIQNVSGLLLSRADLRTPRDADLRPENKAFRMDNDVTLIFVGNPTPACMAGDLLGLKEEKAPVGPEKGEAGVGGVGGTESKGGGGAKSVPTVRPPRTPKTATTTKPIAPPVSTKTYSPI